MEDWLKTAIEALAAALSSPGAKVYPLEIRAVLAVLLVSLTCGIVGSLVIGNRMAFFSDAMAHTAFAGVSLALLGIILATGATTGREVEPYLWVIPLAMCAVGAVCGILIAFVREKTNLANDTVIGVFFAAALGLAALLLRPLRKIVTFDLEGYLFGDLTSITEKDLLILMLLAVATVFLVGGRYNSFVFGSFNPSLARSRGIAVRLNNYLFIVLLAMVVNLSIRAVGILLINALLIVPAAAAANVSGNLRRMFWFTCAGSVAAGLLGYNLSTRMGISLNGSEPLPVGPAGAIVLVIVAWFAASLALKAVRQKFFGSVVARAACSADHGDGQYPHAH